MSKDKRVKACPNADCNRSKEKYRYKSTDMYCTICGTELVYVCADCFKRIADEDPKHIRCAYCEAKREDLKHSKDKKIENIKGGMAKVVQGGVNAAKIGANGIASAAQKAYEKVSHDNSISERIRQKRFVKDKHDQSDDAGDCKEDYTGKE